MGLTPEYVDVLQRQWMQDDLATITNTYPDHEDLQGPTGYNVACTIAGFVPRHSQVITTEQQMRPLLVQSCDQAQTHLRKIGWLESGLIPDDILDRFPYKEHPDNIALVAAMAEELGCPYDAALEGNGGLPGPRPRRAQDLSRVADPHANARVHQRHVCQRAIWHAEQLETNRL